MTRNHLAYLIAMSAAWFCCNTTEPPPPPPSGPDTTSHSIAWQVDSIGDMSSCLLDVWGTSVNNVYAVGWVWPGDQELLESILQFNGTTWTPMEDDSLRWWLGGGLLAGIHGISDTMIFVVGSRASEPIATGFAAKWDGRRWLNVSPDSSQPLFTVLVRSSSDVYAAGAHGTILHYDGSEWHSLPSGTDLSVWDLTVMGVDEVYAVASDFANSFAGSVILRISGITVTPDQWFAVGQKFGIWGMNDGEGYATGEWVFHKTRNSRWEQIAAPDSGVVLWSVSGTAANDVMVAGAYGAVAHWSGKSWYFYDGLYDRTSSRSYFAAFAVKNKYFLVGSTVSHALITVGTRNPL